MSQVLTIVQIILALALIIMILSQSQGAGLGSLFGSGSEVSHSKRGLDRVIFTSIIGLAALFLIISIARMSFGL